jgi:hydroxymethylbilane synthase
VRHIIIGSRGSDLALWQANHVRQQLLDAGYSAEIKIIQTRGDAIQDLSFDKIEGKGFFTKEIEDALLRGEIDVAVHSHKDLQTDQPEGLCIGAVSDRANPEDVLLIRKDKLDSSSEIGLGAKAIIGTSSSRRKSQLRALFPEAEIRDLRGNVPTRVDKLRRGDYDAIVLARAGLERLGIAHDDVEMVVLSTKQMVPAPAQGVLALQCRDNDKPVLNILSELDNSSVRRLVEIERAILAGMDGGCQLPLGVLAKDAGDKIRVHIAYASSADEPVSRFLVQGSDERGIIEEALEILGR